MANDKASVGIGVEARVDRSVSRAFDDLERQNQRLGKSSQRLKNETSRLGRENSELVARPVVWVNAWLMFARTFVSTPKIWALQLRKPI